MNCRQFTEVASAWLDGELAPDVRAGADEHLAGCPECSRLAEDLAAADGAVASQPAAERSEDQWSTFNRRLMVRIAMDERGRSAGRRFRWKRVWRSSLIAAGAAAALLAAAWLGYSMRPVEPAPGPGPGEMIAKSGPEGPDVPDWMTAGPGTIDVSFNPDVLDADRREELERLLAAAERVLVRLSNADPGDREELAAIRSAVIDSGLSARLAEARRAAPESTVALAAARPLEMILTRLANGSPSEAEEFKDIRNLVLDTAMVEHTRSLRSRL